MTGGSPLCPGLPRRVWRHGSSGEPLGCERIVRPPLPPFIAGCAWISLTWFVVRTCYKMADADDAPLQVLQLPDELLRHIASFLPPPEVPCTLRLVCKRLNHVLLAHNTVRVSPGVAMPAHAADWWRRTRAASADSLTIAERRAMVLQAAKLGDLAVLQDVIAAMGCLVTHDMVMDCVRSGFLAGCEHLAMQPLNEYSSWALDAFMEAAATGNLQLVKWAMERVKQTGPEFRTGDTFSVTFGRFGDIIGRAAERGHGHVCDELLQVSGNPQADRLAAAAAAARGGHVALMDGLLSGGPWAGSLQGLVAGAARGCDLATLQRVHSMLSKQQAQERQQQLQQEQQPQQQQQQQEEQHIYPKLLAAAVSSPTPDWAAKAQWLLQQGHPRDARSWDLQDVAALPDAVKRVEWMRREGVEFLGGRPVVASILTDAAARTGDLPLLTALLDCGAEFGHSEMGAAGSRGHTAWLQQLYERGCSMSLAALFYAAGEGHAELVQWLWGLPGMEQRCRCATYLRFG